VVSRQRARRPGDRANKLNTFECLRFLAINSLRRSRLEKDALEGTAPDRYVISERRKGTAGNHASAGANTS
jgi:hypothetical protein